MYDFLGVTENWAALENQPWTIRWSFVDDGGEAVSLDGVIFKGTVVTEEGEVELAMEKSEVEGEGNVLVLSCPGLPEGRHYYEVFCESDSGEQNRLLSGYVGVIPCANELLGEIKSYASRTVSVRLSKEGVAKVRLEWLACSMAAQAAQQAWEYLDEMRKKWAEIDEMLALAESAGKRLEGLDESLTAAEALINAAIEDTIPYVGENGNWWRRVGERAYDLGMRAIGRDGIDGRDGVDGLPGADGKDGADGADGRDGQSPQIRWVDSDVDGQHYEGFYWYAFNDDTGSFEFTKTRAEAKDGAPGRDADDFERLLLDDVSQLPEEGRFGMICYVRKPDGAEGYMTYMWLQKPDGTAEWVFVPDDNLADHYMLRDFANAQHVAGDYEVVTPDDYVTQVGWVKKAISAVVTAVTNQVAKMASTTLAGLVKLSSSRILADGGVIGVNSAGQILVIPATTTAGGAVKLSSSVTLDTATSAVVGMNASGQMMVPKAAYRRMGTVMLGTAYDVVANNTPYCVTIPYFSGDKTYNSQAGNLEGAFGINLASASCLKYSNNSGKNGSNTGNALWLDHDESLNVVSGKLSAKTWVATKFDKTNPRPVNSAALEAYVNSLGFVKGSSANYVTTTQMNTAINTAVNNALKNYVTTTAMNNALKSYVTTTVLNNTLNQKGYVTTTAMNNTLKDYMIGKGGIKYLEQINNASFNALKTKQTNTYYVII